MVNIVDIALAVTQLNQCFDARYDVFVAQRTHGVFGVQCQTHVHFDPANSGQIITLRIEEQRVEQVACGFYGGWLARTHDAVYIHERGVATHVFVCRHRVAHVGADVDVVDIEDWDVRDTSVHQFLQRTARNFAFFVEFPCQLIASFDIDRAGVFVDDVARNELAEDVVERHQKLSDGTLIDQLLHRTWGDFLASFRNDFACGRIHKVIRWASAAHTLWEELGRPALAFNQTVINGVVVGIHDRLLVHTEGIEQGRHGQFTATVDARKHEVFGVELKVQPRAAVGDNTAGEQEFPGGMGFALVVVKEHAGGAVHLGYDHTLGTVHNERPIWRHQGHIAHEHVLFFDVLDGLRTCVFVHIKHDQTQSYLERRRIGHIPLLTLFNIVLRLFQLVLYELKDRSFVEILDRENRLKYAHDTFAVERLCGITGFQEKIIRRFLNLNQVRHL